MVTLTEEIKESLKGTKTAFLATSSKKGIPNVVPIAAFKILDDNGMMLIPDQFFNKTIQNMKENLEMALSWWGKKAVCRSRVRSRSTRMTRSSGRTLPG